MQEQRKRLRHSRKGVTSSLRGLTALDPTTQQPSSVLEERLMTNTKLPQAQPSVSEDTQTILSSGLLDLNCHQGFDAGVGSRTVLKARVSTSAMP